MSDLTDIDYKETTTTNTTDPPTEEERELIRIQTELARQQLQNIEKLAPFQKELLEASLADLRRQGAISGAMDKAISPEDQAAFAKEEFGRARKLGPIQEQILQMQMDAMQGKVSPEQKAAIEEYTNAAYQSGASDIDLATGEGIGLVADELANSRGLRLSDTPILREATLLAESGLKQKAGLARSLRGGQAGMMLQAPQIASGIGLSQQNLAQASQAFQADLRQRAFQNRMTLTGQTASSGIGLATLGSGAGASALSSLSGVRAQSRTGTMFDPSAYMSGWGSFLQGAGSWMGSDRRLKEHIRRIGALQSGIQVYRFRFIGDDAEHVGVMADEVVKVIPEAVSTDEAGYLMVDYGMLR